MTRIYRTEAPIPFSRDTRADTKGERPIGIIERMQAQALTVQQIANRTGQSTAEVAASMGIRRAVPADFGGRSVGIIERMRQEATAAHEMERQAMADRNRRKR